LVIRLPLVHSLVSDGRDENADQRPGQVARHRVLVVDDNVDAAAALARMLRLMAQEVRTAHDGLKGVQEAEAFRPDLILLDIGMLRLNGYDACRRIREQPRGRDVTIVAVTGWGQEEDRRRSKEAGFDHHILKPAEPADIEKLLVGLKGGARVTPRT